MEEESLTQKCGYLEIKQSSKVRARTLKTWRRRWVAVTKMSDLASGSVTARVDVCVDEVAWRSRGDKMTFVLDRVTAVQQAASKTHPFAFEIVEKEAVLVLSGASHGESSAWMSDLKQIFFSEGISEQQDTYLVAVQPNLDSQRVGLGGQYRLKIDVDGLTLLTPLSRAGLKSNSLGRRSRGGASGHGTKSLLRSWGTRPACVEEESGFGEVSDEKDLVGWRLSMLKRFNVEKESNAGPPSILVIECGPNSPTGEGTFRFCSKEAPAILGSIRRFISIAMATKQRVRRTSEVRARAESTMAGYQHLLERSDRPRGGSQEGGAEGEQPPQAVSSRSDSGSSSALTAALPGPDDTSTSDDHHHNDDDDSAPLVARTTKRQLSASGSWTNTNDSQQQQEQLEAVLPRRRLPGMPRNSSVPNVGSLAADPNANTVTDREIARMRTSSMTSGRPRNSVSVSSGDSGVVVVTGEENARRFDVAGRQVAGDQPRVGSNSFDSAVSVDCVAPRKISDVDVRETIQEFPCTPPPPLGYDVKVTPTGSSSHIYQDIDSNCGTGRSVRRHGSAGFALERRRHSTGDVRKENDYEELEALRKGATIAASVIIMADKPPELPARPASLLSFGKNCRRKPGVISTALSFFSSQFVSERSSPLQTPRTNKGDTRSRSGSLDPYTSISEDDLDVRLGRRRRSSDITPYSSRHEHQQSKFSTLGSHSAPPTPADPQGLSREGISFKVEEVDRKGNNGPAQKDLLSFSDTDLTKDNSERSSSKALLDFFLDDSSFHSNPMVTGELVAGCATAVSLERGMAIPMRGWSSHHGWSVPSSFQATGPAGWAHFDADLGGHSPLSSSPATQRVLGTATYPPSTHPLYPYIPYQPDSNMAPMMPLLSSPPLASSTVSKGMGVSARVEGVYLDMTSTKYDPKDDEQVIVDEYIRPSEVKGTEDCADFLLFQ